MLRTQLHIGFAAVNSPKGYKANAGACYAER
jgi:hypothetical protein